MDRHGVAPQASQVQHITNSSNGLQLVGKNWVSRFIKRYSETKSTYS
jgi:hypothetical protein